VNKGVFRELGRVTFQFSILLAIPALGCGLLIGAAAKLSIAFGITEARAGAIFVVAFLLAPLFSGSRWGGADQ
jgi:hypothetical protein